MMPCSTSVLRSLAVLLLTGVAGCHAAAPADQQPVTKPEPVATRATAAEPVILGIDTLEADNFALLRGKRVGIVANPASVNRELRSTVDVLHQNQDKGGYQLVALYGPEHGVWGDVYAGDKIENQDDPRTGLPVFSLYGKTRKPTPEMLESIDILLFDLQDIGSRSYTYISTMSVCLEACAENGKQFAVLDRPNPLGGERIEGTMVEEGFYSFISHLDVPYLHGMTMGELAQLERDKLAPDYEGLTVVPMSGWKRSMVWEDTGLKWVPTSPHVPFASSTYAYAATGVIGELMVLSNGVGYTLPFEVVGDTGVDADQLADHMRATPLAIEGVTYRPARFRPFYATHKGEVLGGVQVYLDPRADSLYEVNFLLLDALDAKTQLSEGSKRHGMFDKANGTDDVRLWIEQGKPLAELFAQWRETSERFRETRKPFLLYD
ncbi:exo-beta-N-acetylmuramidase NamZ family protein [Mucisphaera calidilacus]|uniref:DUF1343 domain-containing protein n=1 Tax=Mucisphaera calidilacus TaxID=2527982 RepID=A0A518BZW2_9BACT|nr:DUF1343 domain-containing protein [Mucisphaera calidilacus]QDU72517.1 hypothetical protein Pan265_23860 [Mucisphaera calidilacus]